MWEIIRRKMKIPLIILGIALFLGLVAFLSIKIVKVGGKSESLIQKEELPTVQEEGKSAKDEKVFIEDESKVIDEKVFAKTEKLFDTDNLEERQLKFLGDNYSALKPALTAIEAEYKGIFADIGDVKDSDYNYEDLVDISKVETDLFSEGFLQGNKIAYDPIGATIVGMYGTHCIVYQIGYNTDYASDLIAIDYTDTKIDTEQIGLFGFGQGKSFFVDPKYTKVVDHGDFKVLYTRGY